MKSECEIVLCYNSVKKAEQIFKSVKVDDLDYVDSKVEKCCLKANIESKKISSFLHTLDDYLSCVAVAEDIVDKN